MLHWRVVFIPKSAEAVSPVDKVRPISVGADVYRAWASFRVREAADWLAARLVPSQGGARGVPCATDLLLRLATADGRLAYGWSLDTA
eukprot:1337600-Alexandrium_andersonii.AAC.1